MDLLKVFQNVCQIHIIEATKMVNPSLKIFGLGQHFGSGAQFWVRGEILVRGQNFWVGSKILGQGEILV